MISGVILALVLSFYLVNASEAPVYNVFPWGTKNNIVQRQDQLLDMLRENMFLDIKEEYVKKFSQSVGSDRVAMKNIEGYDFIVQLEEKESQVGSQKEATTSKPNLRLDPIAFSKALDGTLKLFLFVLNLQHTTSCL